jgi:hypothetical protein
LGVFILRRKVRNQVEKRYRANLNAKSKQLEGVIRQNHGIAGADIKLDEGSKSSRRASILQDSIQTDLRSLQESIDTE